MKKLVTLVALALGCTSPRTEIIARFDTDMVQGPAETLTGMGVRVYSDEEADPRFEQRFELGQGDPPLFLPANLGLVPREGQNRRVIVEADAVSGDTLLFTRRTIATFATGRTLLLDIFLPDRCRFPENQICPEGFTCGASGCEEIERHDLPEFGADAGALDASTGCGVGFHRCAGDCVADSDPNACGSSCALCTAAPTNAAPACNAGSCGFRCNDGFLESGGLCVDADPGRQVFPLSQGFVASALPTFRWQLPSDAEGARVEVCRDPACAGIETTFDATGTSGTPAGGLPGTQLVYYWRISFIRSGVVDTTPGPIWSFAFPWQDETVTALGSWPLLFDTNLDGYSEIAVGAPDADQVFLYRGTNGGPNAGSPTMIVGPPSSRFGASIAGFGDVDGDGLGDLLVGAPGAAQALLYRGAAGGLASTPTVLSGGAGFGTHVAPAGDVDADGYADVLVAASSTVSLFRGSRVGIVTTAAATIDVASTSIAGGGDVNGDGFSDVVIGHADAASIYLGSASGLDTSAPIALSGAAGSGFGTSVAIAGDTDSDGYADVLVGAPGASTVTVYVGASGGPSSTASYTIMRGGVSDFGIALAYAGDLDQNAYDDVLVGATTNSVYYYLSNPSGIGVLSGWNLIIDPPAGAVGFGRSIAAAGYGDSDRDRYTDVVIGAPGSRTAYFYGGASSGLTRPPDVTLSGAAGSGFGSTVD